MAKYVTILTEMDDVINVAKRLRQEISEAREGDTSVRTEEGRQEEMTQEGVPQPVARDHMVMADVAIFPMEPSIKSLQSTKESVQVLEYARVVTGGRPTVAWLVLNKAKTRTRILREIELLAPKLGLTVARTAVRDLQAFPKADQQGTVVSRMTADTPTIEKGKADIAQLLAEIVVPIQIQREVSNA